MQQFVISITYLKTIRFLFWSFNRFFSSDVFFVEAENYEDAKAIARQEYDIRRQQNPGFKLDVTVFIESNKIVLKREDVFTEKYRNVNHNDYCFRLQ